MKLQQVVAATLLLTGVFETGLQAAVKSAKNRPNILFLSVDDLKPELGCYGAKQIKTPHIDALAKKGTLFEHHYVQQAICGPSRASMFSGLRPDVTKVWDLAHTCREENPSAFTMQEYFKKHGYETAGSGKIMHGFKKDDPPSWSVPYVRTNDLPYHEGKVPAHHQKYQAEKLHEVYSYLHKQRIRGKEYNEYVEKHNARPATEGLDLPDDAYCDGAMTEWGLGMIDQFAESEKPFFLTLGFRKPHLPFVAPKKYWDLFDRKKIKLAPFRKMADDSPGYAYQPGWELGNYTDINLDDLKEDMDKQRELIHGYYACVAYVDALIGKVMKKLKDTGLSKNTIVVLWGDHGWHLGDHNMWCKHSNFEQATRSPLIISDPRIRPSGKTKSMVESVDIFPTLCELAKLDVPEELDGKSLMPILKRSTAKVKVVSLSQYNRFWSRKELMGYALRSSRFRLVAWVDRKVSHTREFDEKLVDSIELYDYKTDPNETQNQANNPEYARIAKKLMAALANHEQFKK